MLAGIMPMLPTLDDAEHTMGFCPCIPCIGRLRTGCMSNFSLWLLGLIVWRACCRRGFEPQQHATYQTFSSLLSKVQPNGCALECDVGFRQLRTCRRTFGRDAMDRIANHRKGGVTDVYDRHSYAKEDTLIMAAVARHVSSLVEGTGTSNVVALR